MPIRIKWPLKYGWLHEYALSKPDAQLEYKESWDAMLYRLHGRIFALLLKDTAERTLLNLKCDPYLSLGFRSSHKKIIPAWHMNKIHWISLILKGDTPEAVCMELVDISYDLVKAKLPKTLRH